MYPPTILMVHPVLHPDLPGPVFPPCFLRLSPVFHPHFPLLFPRLPPVLPHFAPGFPCFPPFFPVILCPPPPIFPLSPPVPPRVPPFSPVFPNFPWSMMYRGVHGGWHKALRGGGAPWGGGGRWGRAALDGSGSSLWRHQSKIAVTTATQATAAINKGTNHSNSPPTAPVQGHGGHKQ